MAKLTMLISVLSAALVFGAIPSTAAPDTAAFDGNWIVILVCPRAADGAFGYTLQFDAAVKAAPYVHPKLATIESKHSGLNGGGPQAVYIASDRPMSEEAWKRAFVRPE